MKAVRRPYFWFGLAMWLVSLVISGFLIQLGDQVMSDLPTASSKISQTDFIDEIRLKAINAEIDQIGVALKSNKDALEDANFRLNSARLDYQNQRTNFENWVTTRRTTGSTDQDPEVLERVKLIEALKNLEREAQREVERLTEENALNNRAIDNLQTQRTQVRNDAYQPYQSVLEYEVLKVFLLRLALTLPLLLISGWLMIKKRQSRYWPIYRGFVIFSLFAFFVELVPYLPSYGGYVRTIIGILIALLVGHFLIKWMEKYLKRKRAEQEKSEAEKRQLITYEDAITNISKGVCPSCDRQFANNQKKGAPQTPEAQVDYCVHCGFCLFNKCGNCGTRENSFYKFCGSCGVQSDDPIPAE